MNIAAQIKQWQELAQAKQTRREALLALAMEANRTLTEEEETEDAQCALDVVAAEKHVKRLQEHEAVLARRATTIITNEVQDAGNIDPAAVPAIAATRTTQKPAARPPLEPARATAPAIIIRNNADDSYLGQTFTRMAIARMVGKMNGVPAHVVAHNRWGKTNPVITQLLARDYIIRAANEVPGGGEATGEWGAELVQADTRYQGDFIEYLHSKTIFDQLALRIAPAHVKIKGQDGVATANWVGEGKAIPVSALDFMDITLVPHKVAALTAISKELLRDSSPSAELLVREALAKASGQVIDTTFLSNAAASAGIKPAGIFNGVAALSSLGTDGGGVRLDVQQLMNVFIAAKNGSGLAWLMNPSMGLTLSLMRTTLGIKEFENIGPEGGTFFGFPAYTGDNVDANTLGLIKPSDIYKIGDEGVSIDMSTDATIEMSSAPTGDLRAPTAASQAQVSMFQNDSVAVKVVRSISYAKRRTHAAQWIDDADYDVSAAT